MKYQMPVADTLIEVEDVIHVYTERLYKCNLSLDKLPHSGDSTRSISFPSKTESDYVIEPMEIETEIMKDKVNSLLES